MVVTFCICEGGYHLAVHSDGVEAAMVDFYVCQPLFCEVIDESGGRLSENKTVLSDEFRPVAYDCFKVFRCLGFEYAVVECIAHYELVYDTEPFGYDFTTFLILVLK